MLPNDIELSKEIVCVKQMPATHSEEELTGGWKSRVPKCPTGSWLLELSIPAHSLLTTLESTAASTGSSAKVKEHCARCCTGRVTNSLLRHLQPTWRKNS